MSQDDISQKDRRGDQEPTDGKDPRVDPEAPTYSEVAETLGDGGWREVGASVDPGRRDWPTRVDGRYRVVEFIGEGGMGTVLEVEDCQLSEVVALKVLHAEIAGLAEAVDRFRREVKLARRVTHRNVVRTYEFGVDAGRPYLTMEYIPGESLRGLLDASGPLSSRHVRTIAGAVGRGLHAAHEGGVLHRDLKPENVLVADNGRIALTDFGIAGALRRETAPADPDAGLVGTPGYISPEQVEDGAIDQRADVFSFGILLFEMTAGRLPWEADSPLELATMRLREPAPSLADVAGDPPDDLVEAVDAALSRRPEERPSTIPAMQAMLHGGSQRRGRVGTTIRGELSVSERIAADEQADIEQAVLVAVAPFEFAGPSEEAYLGSGLKSEIIHHLSGREGVEVRLRGEYSEEAARQHSPLELGAALGVDFVVAGRIGGEPLALRAGLVSVERKTQIWSETIPLDADRQGDVVESVVGRVAETLELEERPSGSEETLSAAASSLLMQGTSQLREKWFADLTGPLELLERARQTAGEHPRILAALAVARARQSYLEPERRDAHLDRATQLARRAIDRAADRRIEPRLALAMAHFNAGRYGRAVATLRTVLLRDETAIEAHDLMGRILLEIGPLERAVEHLERAVDLNPFFFRARWDLARGRGLLGRWEAMVETLAEPVDSAPQELARAMHAARLLLWHEAERLEATVADYRDELVESPGVFRQLLEVRETGHLSDRAERAVRRAATETRHGSRFGILVLQAGAEMALYAGRSELAFEFVDAGVDKGLTDLMWLLRCPLFDGHRDDHRFVEHRARVAGRVDSVRGANS